MGDQTKIEWCDASWTPIRARNVKTGWVGWHCQKISLGCENCYAESMNRRIGTRLKYVPADAMVELYLDEEKLTEPLRWKKPRRVFVCSMTDLFADFVPDEWIERVFDTMHLATQHTFQVLTKRSQRMREWIEDYGRRVTMSLGQHSPNVWLGVSAEDQQRLDERVPDLLVTPAAVRFVSAEPLIGPLRFAKWDANGLECSECPWTGTEDQAQRDDSDPEDWEWLCPECEGECAHIPMDEQLGGGLHWVIVGGESGPRARPMDVAWAGDIVQQCAEAGVACFVKQLGAFPVAFREVGSAKGGGVLPLKLKDTKGGDPEEWPEDLRVQEYPA